MRAPIDKRHFIEFGVGVGEEIKRIRNERLDLRLFTVEYRDGVVENEILNHHFLQRRTHTVLCEKPMGNDLVSGVEMSCTSRGIGARKRVSKTQRLKHLHGHEKPVFVAVDSTMFHELDKQLKRFLVSPLGDVFASHILSGSERSSTCNVDLT